MWLDTITAREAADKSPDLSCEDSALTVLSGLFCEQHYMVINSFNGACPNQPIHTSWDALASEDEPLRASVATFFFFIPPQRRFTPT